MTIKIDLDTLTMEELEYFKNIIELKIEEKKLEQERLIDNRMIKTYRICMIENIKILLSVNPRIDCDHVGLYSCIKEFQKEPNKIKWIKENFTHTISFLNIELIYNYKKRNNELLDRRETRFLLGEFLRELERLEIE